MKTETKGGALFSQNTLDLNWKVFFFFLLDTTDYAKYCTFSARSLIVGSLGVSAEGHGTHEHIRASIALHDTIDNRQYKPSISNFPFSSFNGR